MEKKYHFITGLPRSGSTLLTSILNQNPRFHSSISDPFASLVRGVLDNCQEGAGSKAEVPIQRRINLLHSMFDGFYKHVDKPVVFNTNRAWTHLTFLLKELYPDSKMLVCVRDINWIIDSFESAHRRNPLSKNTFFGGLGSTVYDHADDLMKSDGIVGFPYIGIKQAITGNERNNLFIIEYEELCKNPEGMMRAVYNFIGEEYFEHDYNNVEASWDEYDEEIGVDLHKVRKKIEFIPRQMIIPPDIQSRYKDLEVWRY
jgi:sulfotransferase